MIPSFLILKLSLPWLYVLISQVLDQALIISNFELSAIITSWPLQGTDDDHRMMLLENWNDLSSAKYP